MKKKQLKPVPVTDLELLDKFISFLNCLRPVLPSSRLKDCCGGAIALAFELFFYLDKNPEYHGNY